MEIDQSEKTTEQEEEDIDMEVTTTDVDLEEIYGPFIWDLQTCSVSALWKVPRFTPDILSHAQQDFITHYIN